MRNEYDILSDVRLSYSWQDIPAFTGAYPKYGYVSKGFEIKPIPTKWWADELDRCGHLDFIYHR